MALLSFASPVQATSVKPMNVVDLLSHSQDIVAGRVVKVVDGFDSKGLPYTEVTMNVLDTIRGSAGETYTFRQFGLDKPRTLADGRVYLGRPAGWPTWRKDEVAVVFMYPKARYTGFHTTVGLGYGKVSVGNDLAMNSYENAGMFEGVRINRALLDENERRMLDTKKGPIDVATFRKFVHRAVEGNWIKKGSLAHASR
jgi:hypothetical protein